MPSTTLITLKKINKSYGKGDARTPVLRNVNLKIRQGEFLAIMGPSGSGKTTLMNIIGLLDRPTTGHYSLLETETHRLKDPQLARLRRQTIGFVFQNFNLLGRMTVRANVELPMLYTRIKRRRRRERAEKLLRVVGLGRRLKYKPTQLSGGEMQRVAIARALANQPDLLLADEPTGNLDSRTGGLIMRILKKLHQRGTTIIVVTHNQEVAKATDRTVQLQDGRIVRGKR